MKITKETDYAIRSIRAIATDSKHIVSAKSIAEKEYIPVNFLFKILKTLNKAGYIKIHRGCDGGYELIKSPDEITIKDMIDLFEGGVHLNACTMTADICPNKPSCAMHKEFLRIDKLLEEEFSKHSLLSIFEGR